MKQQRVTINGYEISKVECSRLWAVMKVGVTRGGWTFVVVPSLTPDSYDLRP